MGYSNVGSAALGLSPQFPLSPFSIPDKAQWPYVQQWNLDIQRELPGHFVTSVAYVGSKGTHLTLQRDLNQLHAVPSSENPFAPGQPIRSSRLQQFQRRSRNAFQRDTRSRPLRRRI